MSNESPLRPVTRSTRSPRLPAAGGAEPIRAQATTQVRSPVDALVYALNLKYVQAEFYRMGNEAGVLAGQEADLLAAIAYQKQQHVAALTAALLEAGGEPPVAPAVDFAGTFADRDSYLKAAADLETTVVGAYVGMPSPTADGAGAFDMSGIFSVDARCAAILASLAGFGPDVIFAGGFAQPRAPGDVLEDLRPWIAGPWAMAAGAGITN